MISHSISLYSHSHLNQAPRASINVLDLINHSHTITDCNMSIIKCKFKLFVVQI